VINLKEITILEYPDGERELIYWEVKKRTVSVSNKEYAKIVKKSLDEVKILMNDILTNK